MVGIFIGSSYINVGQNTIYLQKFDVNDESGSDLFWHQYMTNVLAPYSESKSIYTGYQKMGLLNTSMTFIIPVYENMKNEPTDDPSIQTDDFMTDNTKVYCNANQVNIRTGPSTSYEIITTVNKLDKMTRMKEGKQTGERWDKVKLENGIIGYIYQTYVTEEPPPVEEVYNKVTDIRLNEKEIYIPVGETFQIKAIVEPENANNKTVVYSSQNQEIATIQEDGIITAKQEGETIILATSDENEEIQAKCILNVVRKMEDDEIYFDSSLTVNGLEVSGIDYEKNKVGEIKQKIVTNLEIEIVNVENEILQDEDSIGTGCKILVKEDRKVLRQYQIIVYGDANGDGKINSVDLLVLQRHILEIEPMEEIFRKATNIQKDGKNPTSVDLLRIQRHILGLQIIEQQ